MRKEHGNLKVVTMVTQYEYDAKGRLTRMVDPALEDEITEYDPATGKQSATTDKNNVRTEYEYDGNGSLKYIRARIKIKLHFLNLISWLMTK